MTEMTKEEAIEEAIAELARRKKKKTAPVPIPPKEIEGLDYLNQLVGQVNQGLTMGFSDEIVSAIKSVPQSLMTGENIFDVYRSLQDKDKAKRSEFWKQNKKASMAANMAGAGVTGLVGGARALAMPPIRSLAAANPATAAMVLGGTEGAIAGAGDADTMADVPMGMVKSGGTGLAFSGAIAKASPYAGKVAGNLWNKVKSQLPEPADKSAARIAGQFLDEPIEDMVNKAKELGDDASITDVAGIKYNTMAQNIAQRTSSTQTATQAAVMDRNKSALSRVFATLKKLSGGDTGLFARMKRQAQKRMDEATPFYDAAWKDAVDPAAMDSLVGDLQRSAFEAQGTGIGRSIKSVVNSLTKSAKGQSTPKLDMKQLHWAKMDLDDNIKAAYGDNKPARAGQLIAIQKRLLAAMDGADGNGNYAQARKIWSDSESVDDAVKLGRRILKDNSDEMQWRVSNMSKAEKEAFINGATEEIRDMMMARKTGTNVSSSLAVPIMRERLKTMFDDPKMYEDFMRSLDAEDMYFANANRTYGGSQTQNKQQAEKLVDEAYGGRPLLDNEKPGGAVSQVWSKLTNSPIPDETIRILNKLNYSPARNVTQRQQSLMQKFAPKVPDDPRGLLPGAAGAAVNSGLINYQQ